jgi:type I restriction enzyme S subunit
MTFSKREVSIGEVCEIKQGRYLAPNQMEQNPTEDSPVPVIGGNGVLGYTTQSTFSFPVPLVTCRGSKCGLMQWAEPPTWISNNAMAVYFKDGEGDNFFLHQYLLNLSFEDVTTGSAQPQITVTNLSSKRLSLPDLETQTAISKILKNIEGKITINNALSKTLEDIAQTIFKSWFIDFDPVKAKINGEKPIGMDDETAALFPDSFEESELGLIPKGWSAGKFGDFTNLLMGQSPPGDSYNSDGVGLPFYQGRTDFGFRFPKRRIFCTQENRVAQAGETLISVRAPVGDINQAIGKCIIGRGVASVMHKSGSEVYTYSLLKSLYPVLAYYNGEGTVFGAINRNDFHNLLIIEPSQKVVKAYDRACSPINDEVRTLHLSTETLIGVRDSLLPRLISGELQIPEEMLAS